MPIDFHRTEGSCVRGDCVTLRLAVTERCNLRCSYCRPPYGSPAPESPAETSDEDILSLLSAIDEVRTIRKLRLTGGEPLVRPGLPELIRKIRRILPAAELGLTTNGTLLSRCASRLRTAGLASINISLDTVAPASFTALTGGGELGSVLEGITAARDAGFEKIKLNAVLLRTVNGGGLSELVRIASEFGCEIRFIELMPFGVGARIHGDEYLSAGEALGRLRREFSYLGRIDGTATSHRHVLEGGGVEVTVGFITTMSEPFCSGCRSIRLDSRGRLYTCLRSEEGADLLTHLRVGDNLRVKELVASLIKNKRPVRRHWPTRPMAALGG